MTPPSQVAVQVFVLTSALLVLFFAVIWAMGWFRRNYLRHEEEEEKEPPYNITQLREMYEDGIITGEEFERLRRTIYGRRPHMP